MIRKAVFGLLVVSLVILAFVLIGYPYFFRGDLAKPLFEIDEKEGKVWLNSKIVIETWGYLSEKEIQNSLKISPPILIGKGDLKVEHLSKFPWQERLPWAKTKITINSQKREIFKPETEYKIWLAKKELSFQTITLPRVILTVPENKAQLVKTHLPVKVIFNEPIQPDLEFFSLEPKVKIDIVLVNDTLFLQPQPRFENSTTYTLTIKKGLKDKFDHSMKEDFTFSFTTEPPISVVKATPIGSSQKIDSVVKVFFDRPPLPEVAEGSFSVRPKVEGKFTWENEMTLVWTPTQKLPYSTEFTLAIGGKASWQDPIEAYEWDFRTQDPPVFVKIEGSRNSPTTLKAVASGGLGKYSYKWSSGETTDSIFVEVPAGETWSFSVLVSSGDQTATAEIVVKGPALPPPEPQPPLPSPAPPPGEGMKFVLTFDDSGSRAIVSGILDVLAKYGAKAIFFPTGSWAHGSGAPYIQRMLAEGHLVCNHTRDHANLSLLSPDGIREQILGGAEVGSCNLLRPPYGEGCPFSTSYQYVSSVASGLGYQIYCWTVDPKDWSDTSVSYITNTILNEAHPGGIAVLHMRVYNTLLALPAIIEGLQAAGYILSY